MPSCGCNSKVAPRSSQVAQAGSAARRCGGSSNRGWVPSCSIPTPTAPRRSSPSSGDRVTAVAGDSNDDEAVAAAIAAARALGVFSVAVSATGVVIRSPRLVDADGSVMAKEVLLANLELHVCGPFNLARLAAAAFAENDPDADGQRGVIVQTASISAFDGQVDDGALRRGQGRDRRDDPARWRATSPRLGVRVCAIAPGSVATPRVSSPTVQAMLLEDIVFPKRLGEPDEYARLVETILQQSVPERRGDPPRRCHPAVE